MNGSVHRRSRRQILRATEQHGQPVRPGPGGPAAETAEACGQRPRRRTPTGTARTSRRPAPRRKSARASKTETGAITQQRKRAAGTPTVDPPAHVLSAAKDAALSATGKGTNQPTFATACRRIAVRVEYGRFRVGEGRLCQCGKREERHTHQDRQRSPAVSPAQPAFFRTVASHGHSQDAIRFHLYNRLIVVIRQAQIKEALRVGSPNVATQLRPR